MTKPITVPLATKFDALAHTRSEAYTPDVLRLEELKKEFAKHKIKAMCFVEVGEALSSIAWAIQIHYEDGSFKAHALCFTTIDKYKAEAIREMHISEVLESLDDEIDQELTPAESRWTPPEGCIKFVVQ